MVVYRDCRPAAARACEIAAPTSLPPPVREQRALQDRSFLVSFRFHAACSATEQSFRSHCKIETSMSSADRASEIAFAIAAGAPIVPPRHPAKRGNRGFAFDMDDVDVRNLDAVGMT